MLNSSNFSKFHLSVNCPVGEPAVSELGVDELSVGEQSVTHWLPEAKVCKVFEF
jgi:hypothetical protein